MLNEIMRFWLVVLVVAIGMVGCRCCCCCCCCCCTGLVLGVVDGECGCDVDADTVAAFGESMSSEDVDDCVESDVLLLIFAEQVAASGAVCCC